MGFFYSQFIKSYGLPYPKGYYAGKTIVITGGNSGLGKEAARHFVRLGASRMIITSRSLERGEEAKRDIETTTNCSPQTIQVWPLNLSSYDSVLKFGARVVAELDRVDIFIANAGIASGNFRLVEGHEESITVNVISTFLLAALIMPTLKATATKFDTRPTLSFIVSEVHGHTTFPQKFAPEGQIFATVSNKEKAEANWDDQYPVSKLLQVYAGRALADRNDLVTVNLTNPGLCHSGLSRETDSWVFWLIRTLAARSTEVGSRTLVWAGSQGAETHGKYLSDCEVSEPASVVTDKDGRMAQERVWAELVGLLEDIRPGVTANF
ncbi:putative short-chain dehydrogenase [Apodospora peruviana]|uniref:Short-chain dehydrogenase n=1 Tax=Apodospora peruviana TaxID=516989 RepID=A0AAE0IHA1_9PEZI|nr:putative short-chain dehydrogenase [Apodospora peruviana]